MIEISSLFDRWRSPGLSRLAAAGLKPAVARSSTIPLAATEPCRVTHVSGHRQVAPVSGDSAFEDW